jgi:hypothetical protein
MAPNTINPHLKVLSEFTQQFHLGLFCRHSIFIPTLSVQVMVVDFGQWLHWTGQSGILEVLNEIRVGHEPIVEMQLGTKLLKLFVGEEKTKAVQDLFEKSSNFTSLIEQAAVH